jgi:enoyl-CoA hydratase/carnithine racemase
MIHEASTIAMGDAKTMQRTADLLESISSEIAGIYAERTGGDEKELRDLMLAETWMDADKAKELGFVHSVVSYDKKEKAKASFDSTITGSMSILSKLFPGNDEVAKLEAALSEAETLRADLEAAQARVGELTALADENILLKSELNEVNAKLTDAEKLANENAETITELQAKTEKVDELAAIKAAELLAAQGHPQPVNLVGDGDETKSILDQFNELKGGEATAFFKANRKAILAEQSKLNRKQ